METTSKIFITIGAAMLTVACSEADKQAANTYTDPFAYCAAVGTVDQPGADYTGDAMPAALVDQIRTTLGLSADAPAAGGSSWRCMNGAVYACYVGANIPCHAKADESEQPTEAMTTYCSDNPDAEEIPTLVTGRTTVYGWGCSEGEPQRLERVFETDDAGYITQFWRKVEPAESK